MKKIQGLVIPVEKRVQRVDFEPTLEAFQKTVADGGYVEAVTTGEYTFWLDEDGKSKSLPRNVLAEFVYRKLGGKLFPFDFIAGTVLLTGLPDANGDTLGLTDSQLAEVLNLIPAAYL